MRYYIHPLLSYESVDVCLQKFSGKSHRSYSIQELNEEDKEGSDGIETLELHDMLEFAENYFNDHEKSPQGTISLGTLKRNSSSASSGGNKYDLLPKSDMISYYKGTSIPNSHIHLFDPENVTIACSIFKGKKSIHQKTTHYAAI